MGNCCSSPDKLDKEPESVCEATTTLVGSSNIKSVSLQNKSESVINSNTNDTNNCNNNNNQSQEKHENTISHSGEGASKQFTSTANSTNNNNNNNLNTASHSQSINNQENQAINPPLPIKNGMSSQISNSSAKNNSLPPSSNQIVTNSNMNPQSIHESGSLIGDSTAQKRAPNKTLSKEHIDSTRIMEDASSLKGRVDTQEKDDPTLLESIVGKCVVKTKEQLQDNETGKYLFLCRSDSAKSFILQMPHVQAQSPKSMEILFDIANKYVRLVYGTEAITLELLFGMQNLKKSVLSHSDCFPAYFKTREAFEDSYVIQVKVPSSVRQPGAGESFEVIQLNVFPSMTADDAKKALCNLPQLGLNPNDYAIFRSLEPRQTSLLEEVKLIPMSDEDKFGLYIQDEQFALKNIEQELLKLFPNKTATQENSDVFWQLNSEGPEIPLQKKGDISRKVVAGINIEYECKGNQCKQANKKFIQNIGVGMFDLLDSQKPQCPGCQQNQQVQYSQIAFFQCRFAFSGMQDFKKKAAVKWGVAHQPLSLKKLDQKEILKKPVYVQISWDKFFTGWTRFKIFAKRLDIQSINDENEEILHNLSMEDTSSHKICGVCKQNVVDHMQHTLDCGHSYHKLCINLLPSLFAELKCPLCK